MGAPALSVPRRVMWADPEADAMVNCAVCGDGLMKTRPVFETVAWITWLAF